MRIFKKILSILLLLGGSTAANAQQFDNSAGNLMVVLRESIGANKLDETLVSTGKIKTRLSDGREVELDPAWFEYLGDMPIRFVFDTPTSMPNATREDLVRLGLTPEQALALAMRNIHRVYGKPAAASWEGLFIVEGKLSDIDSSYFLDHEFWTGLLKQHPEGIVAMVVKRGALLYAPLSDQKAVEHMRKVVRPLYVSSEQLRISSALYLFKDGKWSVFQAPESAE